MHNSWAPPAPNNPLNLTGQLHYLSVLYYQTVLPLLRDNVVLMRNPGQPGGAGTKYQNADKTDPSFWRSLLLCIKTYHVNISQSGHRAMTFNCDLS